MLAWNRVSAPGPADWFQSCFSLPGSWAMACGSSPARSRLRWSPGGAFLWQSSPWEVRHWFTLTLVGSRQSCGPMWFSWACIWLEESRPF
jgi:hypothetical protein